MGYLLITYQLFGHIPKNCNATSQIAGNFGNEAIGNKKEPTWL